MGGEFEIHYHAKLIGGPAAGQFVQVSSLRDTYRHYIPPDAPAYWDDDPKVTDKPMNIVEYHRISTGDFRVLSEPRP